WNVDLLTLFAPAGKGEPRAAGPQSNATSVPWTVGIDDVECKDGELVFTDQAVKQEAVNRLHAVDLTLRDVDSNLNHPLHFIVTTRLNKAGRIDARGSLVPASLTTRGTLRVASLGLSAITPYLPPSVHLDVATGALDVDGAWNLQKKGDISGVITGKVGMTGLALKDLETKRDLFGCASCTLDGIDLHLAPNTLRMRSAVVQAPRAFLEKDEHGMLNIVRALGKGTKEDTGQTAFPVRQVTASDALQSEAAYPAFFNDIHVGRVSIAQGGVAFHDRSLSPDFTARLDQVNAVVTNVSLDPNQRAVLDLNATLNNHAPVFLSGTLSPLRRPIASDLVFRLAHMDMTSLTPYTLKSLAYPVRRGKLNWNGKFRTENYVLDASNTFFVEQFELGEKVDVPDAANVPIKLGLALLQDAHGDLTLNVPVRGQLNDPQFRLGGVIFQAILGIFSKIATAPFALLGSIFGGGDDLSQLMYTAGSAEPSPETRGKLDAVTKALADRPGLRVFVTGVAEQKTDQQGLEKQIFMRKLRLQKYNVLEKTGAAPVGGVNSVGIAPEEYETYLFLAYKAVPGKKARRFGRVQKLPVEEMEAVVRLDITVSQDDLVELANQRSRTVQQYLLAQGAITPDRVFVTSSKVIPAGGETSGARVDLSLGK
ncbi:MAG: DUF748 domain-containing protein, partial [Desulfoplanes sp.]|nr:DUF748 domain-containing protein [Desulfoplanes sp.]